MGDTSFIFVPADPMLVPRKDAQKLSVNYIQNLISPTDIEIIVTAKPQLVIGGEMEHILICPACRSNQHTDDFFSAFDDAYSDEGFDLVSLSPCCQQEINLSELQFTYEQDDGKQICETGGFACYQITCLNPNQEISQTELDEVSNLMGCEARIIICYT